MPTVEQSIEVDVPVRTAYDQWTQFEEFPRFMEGVESVTQRGDAELHWVANVAGRREEWDARIVAQHPDERIAWQSIDGKTNAGEVTFTPIGARSTRIDVRMAWEAEGAVERIGGALGLDDRRVQADLERFRQLVEGAGAATGAWRGEIVGGVVETPDGGTSRADVRRAYEQENPA